MGLIQNKVTVSQPNSHVVVKNAGGLRGLTGETGPQGPQGVPGEAATVTAGTTTTLPAGSDATVQNVGSTSAAIFNFGIPKGDKGDTGESGAAATISVGTTTTLEPGEDATVTNSGTSSAAVFDFGIPKGDKGDTGATGADGYSPSATVTKTGDTATITITDKDGTTTASISDGSTPTVNDGTLTIQKNGTTVQTFSADQASNVTANITVPTQFSELSGTVSSSQIEDEAITTGSVSGTGTNITLAGTMEGGAIESVELNGDTEQQTYSGKNKLTSTSHLVSSDNGITVSLQSDGSIKATGTVGSSWNGFNLAFYNTDTIPSGQYTFSIDHSISSAIAVAFRTSDNSNLGNITIPAGSTSATGTISGAIGKSSLWVSATTGTSINFTIKAQLESGQTATSFEPYVGGTASPNPDYPQEVQTVTGEQTVAVVGKNLLDESTMEQGSFNYLNNQESAHTGIIRMPSFISCQPNTTYAVSSNTIIGEFAVVYKDINGNIVEGQGFSVETQTYTTFTTKSNATEMRIRIGKGAYPHTAGVDYKLQLELGNKPTSYAPYQGGSYPINLGKNLFDKDNVNTLGAYIESSGSHGIVNDSASTCIWIPCETNTTYTISRTAGNVFRAVTTSSTPTTGLTTSNYVGNDSGTSITVSTGANGKYIVAEVRNYSSSSSLNDILATIQIEKGSTATTYAPYFTPIELCRIGTYQDYIYKSGEDWYLHKEIGKYTLDGSLAWYESGSCFKLTNLNTDLGYAPMNAGYVFYPATDSIGLWCNYGIAKSGYKVFQGTEKGVGLGVGGTGGGGADGIYVTGGSLTLANFQTILNTSPLVCDYILATATDTQITNATLISELEDLLSATTYSGTTYITVRGDLASPLEVVSEADSKLAPDSVYGAAIKDGAVSVDKIADLKALADALAPYLNS